MSGNPFRRPTQSQHDNQPSTSAERPKSIRKVKKVSFVSPLTSPTEPPSHPHFPTLEELEAGPKSPPPKGLTDVPDNVDTRALLRGDLTAGGTIDLKANEKQENASAPPVSASSFRLQQPPSPLRGPPVNPFSRSRTAPSEDTAEGDGSESSKKKPAMDVDAFKRLLLTGKTDAAPSAESTAPDTMSIDTAGNLTHSREVEPETASSSSSDDSSSDSGAAGASDRTQELITDVTDHEPAAAISTDDFDDFDAASLQPARLEEQVHENAASPLNAASVDDDSFSSIAARSTTTSTGKSQKPPPPPVSRRRGHHDLGRPRSVSNTSNTSNASNNMAARTNGDAPALPRRSSSNHVDGTEALDVRSIADVSERNVSTTTKTKPPPPPARHSAHKPPASLQRSPSSSSTLAQRRASPATNGGLIPPPPPRPRRTEAKHGGSIDASSPSATVASSIDSRRSSQHSVIPARRDSNSSALTSSNQPESSTSQSDAPAQAPAPDMLAELDALQREIDALRARRGSGK